MPPEPEPFYTVTQFDIGRSHVTWGDRVWLSPLGTIRVGDVGIRFFRCATADLLTVEPRTEFKARIDEATRLKGTF